MIMNAAFARSQDKAGARRFIQQQVGHECDSSTAVYTHVSDDFMNTALSRALAPAFAGV
jgi:integrase/recombinase XerC